ncbi:MAG: transglutaminase-like domain-containing protein [Akkermansiaceae bacterium]
MRSFVLILTVAAAYLLLRGSPEGWHVILRVCLAVFVLVLGLAVWGKRTTAKSIAATPERPPRWLDFLSMGFAILVIEALFLLFFASAPEIAEDIARKFDEELHPRSYSKGSSNKNEPASGGGILQTSGNWLWQNNGRRQLGGAGKVRPSNRPEVFLWPRGSAPFRKTGLYLRTFTMALYEADVWNALPLAPETLTSENGVVQVSQIIPEKKLTYQIYHGPNTLGQSLAVTLPNLLEVETSSLRKIAPETYRLPPLAEGEEAYSYRATSSPKFFTANLLPGTSRPEYLNLPSDPKVRSAIEDLAATTKGNSGQRLAQVSDLLASQYLYSLEPKLDPTKDLLLEFLIEKKQGYCEHFATAAALLARSVGFPSRIAYGWSGGRYYEASNMFVFRAKEAHAWTEVKIASGEWVIFDATPANRNEGNSTVADNDESPPVPDGLDLNLSSEGRESLALPPLARLKSFAVIIGGAGLLAFLISLFLKRPEKSTSHHGPGSSLLPPPLSYLSAFRNATAQIGQPMPKGRTLRQQIETLRQEDLSPEFGDELLTYHYQVTYGETPRKTATEKRFISLLKAWQRQGS